MPILQNSILSEGDRRETFREIVSDLAVIVRPRARLNVWQWAARFRFIAKGESAKTLEGPRLYDPTTAPHQLKPQEDVTDPTVQMVVLVMASQVGGKTMIFNNVLGYNMHWTPQSSILMYPTIEAAEKYSKKKFKPMVEASPELERLVKPARSRDSGNTILVKDFSGGSVFFVGANSAPSLRGASGAVLLGDEIDSMRESAGLEGDPIELLFKRGESFPNCVKMLASTPTVKGLSAIWEWFEQSDQEYWFVPCAKCSGFQKLEWKQVSWPKDQPEKAELICSVCQAGLSDAQRVEMYYAGQWRATAGFSGIRGYHLNGIYAPWPCQKGFASRLHQMAIEFGRAVKGGERKLQVWTNTFACELWESASEEIDANEIAGRAEEYGPESVPEGVIILFCSVDVQKDRLELEVIGLGLDDESWGIEYRKIPGDTEQDAVWEDLADQLGKRYRRSDGVELRISATTIDMRHKPHKVREFVKHAGVPRVFPVYGIKAVHQPILVSVRFNKHYRLHTFAVAGRLAKDSIFARLKVETAGPRYMHFPKGNGYNEDYFKGLTAEVLKKKRVRGLVIEEYEKIRERNEPLDVRVYFLAGIDILKPALTIIARKLERSKPGGGEGDSKSQIENSKGSPESTGPQSTAAGPRASDPKASEKKEPERKKIRLGGFGGTGGGPGKKWI